MPDQDPQKTEAAAATPAVEELQKALQETKAQNEKYQKLMADPTMQVVLGKMANGEEIKFASEEQKDTTTPSMKDKLGIQDKPEDVNLDELSNKQMMGIVSETVEEYVSATRDEAAALHKEQMEVMKNELDLTNQKIQVLNAQQQVKDLATQHKDFENYREDMVALSKTYPSVDMEGLYKMAKAEHVLKSPRINEIETEKPESSSPFPQWQVPSERTPVKEGDKSVGQGTTSLRNRTGGKKDFMSLAMNAATRSVRKSNLGGE